VSVPDGVTVDKPFGTGLPVVLARMEALFLLLNLFHWAATVFVEAFDLSQVCLLSFVLVVNVMLIVTLWKSLKQQR
jgi:hypothetical protein